MTTLALKTMIANVNWLEIFIQTILFGIIIEFIRRKFQKENEFLKNELTIRQTTFSKNYFLIIDFYSTFFEHYRLCQKVANYDVTTYPDGKSEWTNSLFFEKLDYNVAEIKKYDPKIRLILPGHVFLYLREKSCCI